MNVRTYFEQLALQLGVGEIKIWDERRNKKIRTIRWIKKRSEMNTVNVAVWDLYCEIQTQVYRHFRLHDNWIVRQKHIEYIRHIAVKLSFPLQRQYMVAGRRDVFNDRQAAWDDWHEIFEDFTKELGFEPAVPEVSPTE